MWKVFFIFPQIVAIFVIFPSSAAYLALSPLWKIIKYWKKILEKMKKNLRIILCITYMAAFGTKNVHSAIISSRCKSSCM